MRYLQAGRSCRLGPGWPAALSITLIQPEHREQVLTGDCLVDTGATYSLRPREIVERLGRATPGGAVGGLRRADLAEAALKRAHSGAPTPTANGATHLSSVTPGSSRITLTLVQ